MEAIELNNLLCAECGKEFAASNPLQQTCSILCRNRFNAKKPRVFNYPTKQCEWCGEGYAPQHTQQKYCSVRCQQRAAYYRNIETHRAYDRIKTRKTTIGYRIRDEHLQKPTREAKWVWDGIGLWSKKYPDIDRCLECNSTVYRHRANGVCAKCWNDLRTRDRLVYNEQKREKYRADVEAEVYKGRRLAEAAEWIGKAEDKEIPITPKIDNLLDNYHEILVQEEEYRKERNGR